MTSRRWPPAEDGPPDANTEAALAAIRRAAGLISGPRLQTEPLPPPLQARRLAWPADVPLPGAEQPSGQQYRGPAPAPGAPQGGTSQAAAPVQPEQVEDFDWWRSHGPQPAPLAAGARGPAEGAAAPWSPQGPAAQSPMAPTGPVPGGTRKPAPARSPRRAAGQLLRRHHNAAGRPARPQRPVRHRDPELASGLAAEALAGNLVITADRVIAWYRLPLLSWTFRPDGDRLAYVAAAAARIASLSGRRCHLRVTSRPFEAARWAAGFDTAVRGPGQGDRRPRPAMPGPCEQHPWHSQPSCPSCVPGAAWIDFLLQQQRRMRQWPLVSRDVYLGVEVTARGAAHRLLGQAWSRAASAERASLAQQAETVRAAVEGAGLGGRPATAEELRWLLIRSCSIGLPAPLPVAQDPRPAPFAIPAATPDVTGKDGLDAWAEDFAWAAEPFGGVVQVTRPADGAAAYATVLTIADMPGQQELAGDSPWIQRTDHLPFPVDWSVTFDVLDPKQTARVMGRQADKIRAQWAHIAEHGQDAPPAMERQMAAVRRIEDEAANSAELGGAYVYAWPRIAVTGDTPEELRHRVTAVTELYAPGVTVRQPPNQFRLLREFIPGEPLAAVGGRRFMHAELLVAGGAAVSVQAGQWNGFPIGATTRTAWKPVLWDPWFLMERANRSGLVTVTGSPGGGKSSLAGLMAYLLTRAGVPVTVLDPSGMLDRLCRIPVLAGHARAVNLLESAPGTLSPYAMIPEPRLGDFRFGLDGQQLPEHAARDAWQAACRAAEAARRALAEDIIKMLLSPRVLAEPGAEDAIGEAVRRAPAGVHSSPRDVIAQLAGLSEWGLQNRGPLLASRLESLADHPLARLFFPSADADPAELTTGRRLLTVMTLRGLVVPDSGRRPEDYTVEERLSIPVLHLAAQLVRRMQFDLPRQARKAVLLDEAHWLARDAVGIQTMNELARDSRKGNTLAVLLSQNPGDLLAAGVANLVGAAFAFRTEGAEELAATCGLLGLPPGRGHEERIAGLSPASPAAGGGGSGECLFRDGCGGLEQVQIDLGADPDLLTALSTTPGAPAPHPDGEVYQ